MNAETLPIAQQNFRERRDHNKGKRIDNSSLPAGYPMYFYCKYCDEPTDTMPEGYMGTPRQICPACEELEKLGAIPRD